MYVTCMKRCSLLEICKFALGSPFRRFSEKVVIPFLPCFISVFPSKKTITCTFSEWVLL